jgi:peptidylprolyl isomerase
MRDILISAAVCVTCLLVALVSQLVAPSTVGAAPAATEIVRPAVAAQAAATPKAAPAAAPAAVGAPLELDPDDPNPTLFAMAPDASSAAEPSDTLPSDAIAGAASLGGAITAAQERTTDSGLRITDLVVGEGAEAVAGQNVVVNYRGTLENGTEFDKSYGRGPFSFPLGAGRVIRGWDEGVAGMKVGGKRRLVIPPELGYGSRGAGGVIPPDATLIFEVELVRVGG